MQIVSHSNRGHRINGASVISRREACPGSARLESSMPNKTSPAAEYGTFIHEGIEIVLPQSIKMEPHQLPDSYKEEDILNVLRACTHVKDLFFSLIKDASNVNWQCESQYTISDELELGGTADFSATWEENGQKIGLIWDYKNGVTPTKIGQVIFYACAMNVHFNRELDKVHCVIYQPNGDVTEQYEILDREQLLAHEERFKEIAKATQAPDAPLVPGKYQCNFCRAYAVCPAVHEKRHKASELLLRSADGYELPRPKELARKMTDEDLVEWLRISPYLTKLDSAIKEYLLDRNNEGNPVEGTTLVEGVKRREFSVGVELAEDALGLYGVELYGKKIRGLGEIEADLVATGMTKKEAKEVVNVLTESKPTASKVVLIEETSYIQQGDSIEKLHKMLEE